NESKWITGEASRKYVHELRHRLTGIMVGIGTVLADDPFLTTRLEGKIGKDAIRIIVDSCGRIPLDSRVLNIRSDAETIIAVTDRAEKDKNRSIEEKRARVIILPSKEGRVDLNFLMKELGERKRSEENTYELQS